MSSGTKLGYDPNFKTTLTCGQAGFYVEMLEILTQSSSLKNEYEKNLRDAASPVSETSKMKNLSEDDILQTRQLITNMRLSDTPKNNAQYRLNASAKTLASCEAGRIRFNENNLTGLALDDLCTAEVKEPSVTQWILDAADGITGKRHLLGMQNIKKSMIDYNAKAYASTPSAPV